MQHLDNYFTTMKFNYSCAVIRKCQSNALNNLMQFTHMGNDITGNNDLWLAILFDYMLCFFNIPVCSFSSDSLFQCNVGNIFCRFNSKNIHVLRNKLLEYSSVIGGNLQHKITLI